jgi:hypothetical protein
MTLSFIFWLLMLLALVLGLSWRMWPEVAGPWTGPVGGLYLFVLLALLGFAVFGSPIRG